MLAELPLPLTVVIPAYQAAATLGACLASVQACHPRPSEIIVVVDGPSDTTESIALAAGVTVLVLGDHRGAAAARNRGVEASSTPLIAFTDADCEVPPDWLSRLCSYFDETDVGGVAGVYRSHPSDDFLGRFMGYSLYDAWYRFLARETDALNTGNCAYRREWLLNRDRLEERLFPSMAAAEDTLVSMSLPESCRLLHAPEIWVYHKGRETLAQFWRQQVTRGYSRALLSTLPLPRRRAGFGKGWAFKVFLAVRLGSTGFFGLGGVWASLTGDGWLALGAAGVFVLPRVDFLVRVYRGERNAGKLLPALFLMLLRDTAWIAGMVKALPKILTQRTQRTPRNFD